MILLQGKGVSKGIAEGPLYFLQKPDTTIVKETGKDIEAEKARIAEAKEKSAAQLLALAEKCREEAGDDAAFVFETHAMFLDDDDYVEGINNCLESEQCNAEYAVRTAGDTFAAMFAAMDDAYMSARAADIKDITQRLLNNLMGIVEGGNMAILAGAGPMTSRRPRPFSSTSLSSWASRSRAVRARPTPPFSPVPWASPPSAAWAMH